MGPTRKSRICLRSARRSAFAAAISRDRAILPCGFPLFATTQTLRPWWTSGARSSSTAFSNSLRAIASSLAALLPKRAAHWHVLVIVYIVQIMNSQRGAPTTTGNKPMTTVAATKMRSAFSDILNRVVYQGERIAVARHGKTVAALVSTDDLELLEALEDRTDLEAARKALKEPGHRSWDAIRAKLAL